MARRRHAPAYARVPPRIDASVIALRRAKSAIWFTPFLMRDETIYLFTRMFVC